MAQQVIWTPEADASFDDMIDRTMEKWSEKEVVRFVDRAYEVIGYIENQPRQYIFSKELNAHRAVINKRVSLYYRIIDETIYLLSFWDNRQNPRNLKL